MRSLEHSSLPIYPPALGAHTPKLRPQRSAHGPPRAFPPECKLLAGDPGPGAAPSPHRQQMSVRRLFRDNHDRFFLLYFCCCNLQIVNCIILKTTFTSVHIWATSSWMRIESISGPPEAPVAPPCAQSGRKHSSDSCPHRSGFSGCELGISGITNQVLCVPSFFHSTVYVCHTYSYSYV